MKYTKMHGLGNDFILFQDMKGEVKDFAKLACTLCDRHTGIGADGIIVAVPSEKAQIGFRIFNADGSEAEMCGNGIRCFAHYVYTRGLIKEKEFTIETLAGIMKPTIVEAGETESLVKVDMGTPIFEARQIPMAVDAPKVLNYELTIEGETFKVSEVLMGVPHAAIIVDDVEHFPLEKWGPLIERHSIFPQGTNVNFLEVQGSGKVRVRTWERGAGHTLACGTGCCGSAVLCHENGIMPNEVETVVDLGSLHIEYRKEGDGRVFMTGPAKEVFETELPLA